MPLVGKACAVVLRRRGGMTEILAFRHPLAGRQVVKGTIKPGESPVFAAGRELFEEAGVPVAGRAQLLGSNANIADGQIWHFVLCPVGPLPDFWTFHTHDDGGHDFAFFWHEVESSVDEIEWNPVFIRALTEIRMLLAAGWT